MPEKQIWLALGAAVCLHVIFGAFAQLNYGNVRPLPAFETIDVQLIPRAPSIEPTIVESVPRASALPTETTPASGVKPTPKAITESIAEPMPQPAQSPPITSALPAITASPPILNSARGTTRGAFPVQEAGETYVPSQWALEPTQGSQNSKGVGLLDDVDCLRALSTDCAALRKEVFAEYELTDKEKVWTERRADTGMPSEFYGLSEREIRLKIGSHIAGENGFMILPGIMIDGPLWDMMHGVKKGCGIKRGINSEGRYDIIKVCPESLPAARDKKYFIPPKVEP